MTRSPRSNIQRGGPPNTRHANLNHHVPHSSATSRLRDAARLPRALVRFLLILLAVPAVPLAGAETKPWRQDRLLVTFWCPPPATDTNLATVAAEGYNLTWTPESGLDVAHRHGLKAMLQDPLLTPESLDDAGKKASLKALVERVRTHPALEAYYIVDEPSAGAFGGLGRLADFLREHDPAHFTYINLFPTYANNTQLGNKGDTVTAYREHLRQFSAAVKPALISYDHYHFFKNRDGAEYFLNLAMIRDSAREAKVPFLNIIQASTIENSWRLVNADELRFLVYSTLAYGGRGISYFLYWGPTNYGGIYQDGVRSPLAAPITKLNREIESLSPALMSLESRAVYHAAPVPRGGEAVPDSSPVRFEGDPDCLLGLFGTGSSAHPVAFMVANRSYKAETVARLRLPSEARRLEEFDRSTSHWKRITNWKRGTPLTVTLRPGDGQLFRYH